VDYSDGNEARLGDEVTIDDIYKGVVVASLDTDEYSVLCPREEWAHLGTGIVVDTSFGGLIHYPNGDDEHIVLARRGGASEEPT
jgi:hypothetical protein